MMFKPKLDGETLDMCVSNGCLVQLISNLYAYESICNIDNKDHRKRSHTNLELSDYEE